MVKVKICGITNLKDASNAVKFGADYLGFIFYPKSPRYITPKKARGIIKRLGEKVKCVGVFVNEKKDSVNKIAKETKIKLLQFHGDESYKYCRGFNNDV